MCKRERPYTNAQQSWRIILENYHIIPMNQRNYDWDDKKEIKHFLNDIIDICENTSQFMRMGSIIYYNETEYKEVWDGQQRLITIILILKALSYVCTIKTFEDSNKDTCFSFSDSIIKLLTVNIHCLGDEDISVPIKTFQQKNPEYINIPKIQCINPYDEKAFADIFNNYSPIVSYYNQETSINNLENHSYICNKCKAHINENCSKFREDDFIRHIIKCSGYDDINIKTQKTKIYRAYEYICKLLYIKFNKLTKIRQFYQFILNNIDLNVCECNDKEYVSKIFEWENNRGKNVMSFDVVKNMVLKSLPDDKKYEIYDKWVSLLNTPSPFKKKPDIKHTSYGSKIMTLGIQILTKNIHYGQFQEDSYNTLINIDKEITYKNINDYFKIIEDIIKIIDQIKNDRYGKLLIYYPSCITWEGYMTMIPVLYKKGFDPNIVKLYCKWGIRNIKTNDTLNRISYSQPLFDLTNKVLNDPSVNYYKEALIILNKNKKEEITGEMYINNNITKSWTEITKIKTVLSFLETSIQNDSYELSLNTVDLEHIHPQKNHGLINPQLIHYLGNLTLYESKNSQNGHKGNRSLKDNRYIIKKTHYKDSIYKITRSIADNYPEFNEEDIKTRTNEFFQLLHKYTDY